MHNPPHRRLKTQNVYRKQHLFFTKTTDIYIEYRSAVEIQMNISVNMRLRSLALDIFMHIHYLGCHIPATAQKCWLRNGNLVPKIAVWSTTIRMSSAPTNGHRTVVQFSFWNTCSLLVWCVEVAGYFTDLSLRILLKICRFLCTNYVDYGGQKVSWNMYKIPILKSEINIRLFIFTIKSQYNTRNEQII